MPFHLSLTEIEMKALVTLVAAADESGLGEKLPGLRPLVATLAPFDGLQEDELTNSVAPWPASQTPFPPTRPIA